jgi:hypothetical protein
MSKHVIVQRDVGALAGKRSASFGSVEMGLRKRMSLGFANMLWDSFKWAPGNIKMGYRYRLSL